MWGNPETLQGSCNVFKRLWGKRALRKHTRVTKTFFLTLNYTCDKKQPFVAVSPDTLRNRASFTPNNTPHPPAHVR